jgi:hypothetical protein
MNQSVQQMNQSVLQMNQSVLQMTTEYRRLMLALQEVVLVALLARPNRLCQQDHTDLRIRFV